MIRIVFFGTPYYVVPVLEAVNKHFRKDHESPIVAVVTKKPTVDAKGHKTFSEIDHWAHKRNIPKFYSASEWLAEGIPADVGILASYGEIIPREVLHHFKFGILNLHPSLLPRYRGASPVQAVIALGDQVTGVSIIKLDHLLDHGPIMTSFKEEVLANDTHESLRLRLFMHGAQALVEMLPAYLVGKIRPKPQDETQAVITRQISREDGFLPTEVLVSAMKGQPPAKKLAVPFIKNTRLLPSAVFIQRYLQALTPWPGIYTLDQGKRLKILKVHLDNSKLIIDEVQLEGKNPVNFRQFGEGYPSHPLVVGAGL